MERSGRVGNGVLGGGKSGRWTARRASDERGLGGAGRGGGGEEVKTSAAMLLRGGGGAAADNVPRASPPIS